jgi:hypothetical protein
MNVLTRSVYFFLCPVGGSTVFDELINYQPIRRIDNRAGYQPGDNVLLLTPRATMSPHP